jgi:putative tryptophan/tyrosine transport system substrate-binding protein
MTNFPLSRRVGLSARMQRREFIAGLGSAAAWPVVARAQQRRLPVIGFLDGAGRDEGPMPFRAFHKGLSEQGFVEGRNVEILYRYAKTQYDRLPSLAADLVNRRVDVIVAVSSSSPALAAKAATSTIPIVFANGGDPVRDGLVASLNRPDGNVTGVMILVGELHTKRLEILHELVPTATSIGYLVNPARGAQAVEAEKVLENAARSMGVRMVFANATTLEEIEPAVQMLVAQGIGALYAGSDLLFAIYGPKIVPPLAARFKLPAIYHLRASVDAGGLISYGTDTAEAWRIVGTYAGRILNGEKPADLPVQRSTLFQTVLNLKAAKALGIEVPQATLLRADEVIE